MRIGIDARFLQKVSQGTGTYSYNLIRHLMEELQGGDELFALIGKKAGSKRSALRDLRDELESRNLDCFQTATLASAWTPVNVFGGYARCAANNQLDVVHTNYLAPVVRAKKANHVVTVHDILFRTHGAHFPGRLTFGLSRLTPWSLARADRIIAVSRFTKQSLMDSYRIPDWKIHVVYEAAEKIYRPRALAEIAGTLSHYRLERPYILFVGRFASIKNLDGLLDAFEIARPELGKVELVLIGSSDPAFPNKKLDERLARGMPGVRVLSGIPKDHLAHLYNGAQVFVLPSFGEGFGLPILEAMASGTPVITSNAGSCPEVAGEAALIVDPSDVDALAQALCEVTSSDGLRKDLTRRGLERARHFSWQRCAEETYDVYRT